MIYKVKHFGVHEFVCPCCGVVYVAKSLVFWLDVIRRAVGIPLVVSSGYRCTRRNDQVGGAISSRHMIGCAADILKPKSMAYEDFVKMCERFKGDDFELVKYATKTYLHFGVPRIDGFDLWYGGEMTV